MAEEVKEARMEAVKEARTEVMRQVFAQGMVLGLTVEVTASNCSSNNRKHVKQLVASRFSLHDSCTAPCCLKCQLPNVNISKNTDWSRFDNKEKNTIAWGRDWLQNNLAPPGMVVLAVQDARWLHGTGKFPGGCVEIKPSATDYMFVLEVAWERCWEKHRTELSTVQ
ncbi:hypothetical protein Vretifemale_8793, partial [Volvox reticuliferus]